MPLNVATLRQSLENMIASPGGDAAECAQLWGDALESYVSAVAPPSLAVQAALGALRSGLAVAFADPNVPAAPQMETAFASFGLSLAGGMAPAFVGVPPPAPVGWAALFAGPFRDVETAAADFAAALDTWIRTGTATPSVGGAPVPWS